MQNSHSKLMMAFLVGSTIGGLTALLFAPQSGRRTRRMLRRRAEDSLDHISDTGREIYGRCQTLAGGAARFVRGRA